MLVSFLTVSSAVLTLTTLYLIYFLLIKPLIGIKFYKKQGINMTFFPLLGSVKACMESFAITDDFYGHWKKQVKQDPKLRAIGGNFLDRPQLYLVDPQLIQEFYKNHENYVKVPEINELIKVITGDSLATIEGETWKRHRKIISSAFRFELLRDMIPDIVDISEEFIDNYKNKDLSKINLAQEFQTIAGDVVGRLFFGKKFSGHKIQGQPVMAFLNDFCDRVAEVGFGLPYLIFGTKVIEWGFLPKYVNMRRDNKEFRDYMSSIIEARKEERSKPDPAKLSASPRTLLDVLLDQEALHLEQPFSTKEIIDEFVVLVRAGNQTTGDTVNRAIYYLYQHPEYKDRLMEEVNKYFKDPSAITIDDLNQMEFMTAFLKETLRCLPAMAGIFDRQSIRDHNLGDLKVKKGTVVNVAVLGNNFNPKYHDHEDAFDPERWLGNSKTKEISTKNPLVYLPFSYGTRNCVGQHLAMIEMRILLSLFLKKYDFELEPNYKLRMTQTFGYDTADEMHFKLSCKS